MMYAIPKQGERSVSGVVVLSDDPMAAKDNSPTLAFESTLIDITWTLSSADGGMELGIRWQQHRNCPGLREPPIVSSISRFGPKYAESMLNMKNQSETVSF